MANITIDTSESQYQNLLNGLGTLRTVMTPRLLLFAKCPKSVQALWYNHDPLLKETLKIGMTLKNYIEKLTEEDLS